MLYAKLRDHIIIKIYEYNIFLFILIFTYYIKRLVSSIYLKLFFYLHVLPFTIDKKKVYNNTGQKK